MFGIGFDVGNHDHSAGSFREGGDAQDLAVVVKLEPTLVAVFDDVIGRFIVCIRNA